MQNAEGLAKLIGEIGSKTYSFVTEEGSTTRDGTWDRDVAKLTFNTATSNPSFVVATGSTDFDYITVNYDTSLVFHIPHTLQAVSAGETLVYTKIEVTMKTTDVAP